ncbi:carbon-nitrogen family hydrolase [Campylobacter geochelonis]|uniref:Hydrolase in agr operon (ORF 5) n=1 Tax=Campylobacter geochelonis TaxID=1780362 RepID=A0A128ECJ8_9BACT|nr:carbon-nitrogen family hydrolase [Campylobacter geochelonis]QKF70533.1 nitrilase domain-containing protein [Campylobacter geochelonis]CZE46092.1 hydrolase in agr operon (ORF 5) [Campylobacter geochelonis]
MRVACINFDSKFEQVDENLAKAKHFIDLASKQKCDTVVLPELFSTGFFPQNLAKFADLNGEKATYFFSNLAKNLKINVIAGSIIERIGDKFYNSSFIFSKDGSCMAKYSKIHLFSHMKEDEFFQSGDKVVNFMLDGVKCGIIICYDLRFPELVRKLALDGVKVLFIVSAWPLSRLKHLEILTLARAVENQIFVVLANSCSFFNKLKFGGNSMIIDPLGEILAKACQNESMISANLELSALEKTRQNISVYKDRKPNLY